MDDALGRLEHWSAHGGTVRLVELARERAEVVLCRCDGGEEVERFSTTDPVVIAWVRANET